MIAETHEQRDLTLNAIVALLIQRTADTKIRWSITADDETFLSAVPSLGIFTISRNARIFEDLVDDADDSEVLLRAKDVTGEIQFLISSKRYPALERLYEQARADCDGADTWINQTRDALTNL
jgi:hypothetical protein